MATLHRLYSVANPNLCPCAVSRLCTLDGRIVHAASELQDGGKYVALEGSRLFRRVAYCALEPAHTTALLHKVSPQHKHR